MDSVRLQAGWRRAIAPSLDSSGEEMLEGFSLGS